VTLPAIARSDSVAQGMAPRPSKIAALVRAARVVHPFPTLLNVAATAGLSCVAVRGAPDVPTLARMLLVMLCAQCAIGVTNDYFDRDLDAATKPWKPVAAGLVSAPAAVALALAFLAAAVALAATLGAGGFTLAMVGMACGLAYDVRLKRTFFSAVPYMIAIPVLPLWVWLTLGSWQPVLWWLLPLGALIGLALHLANTLPDLAGDAAHGVMGLAHRLGRRRSTLLTWAAFASALALSGVPAALVRYDLRFYLPGLVAGCAALGANLALYAVRRDQVALRSGFGALSLASAVLAVGWLAAVT
jgi:4-hydroxybenzoate polyprenyltransferase